MDEFHELLLRFKVMLRSYEDTYGRETNGPLFSRWLPDGMKDAHKIVFEEPMAELSLWFERNGYIDHSGFIVFDDVKREVDAETIPRQGVLDAGPLYGMVKLHELSNDEVEPVIKSLAGDIRYLKLGKKIVTKLIYPSVSKLINIISVNYGQYWLRPLEEWDSRERSLGSYCKFILNLEWSLDNGTTWTKFVPNEPSSAPHIIKVQAGHELEFIGENDWNKIGEILQTDYSPSLSATLLMKAHSLMDQGNIKYALFEAVTALEIAMYEYMRFKLQEEDGLISIVDSLWKLPMPTKVTTIASIIGLTSIDELKDAIDAINIRNNVMHEGKLLPENTEEKLKNLIKTVATITTGPAFKFPHLDSSNSLTLPNK